MKLFTTIKKSVLPNGLTVITTNRQTNHATVAIAINAGTVDEGEFNQGTAHFLEHMLFNGTANREDSTAIAAEIEQSGSSVNAYTSSSMTVYYISGLGDYIASSLDILSDMVVNPALKAIEKERNVILQEFAMYQDRSSSMAYNAMKAAAYPDHAKGNNILGTEDSIKAITAEGDLIPFMRKFYTPNNMVVYAGGMVDHDEFVSMVFKSHLSKTVPVLRDKRTQATYVGGETATQNDDATVSAFLAYSAPKSEKYLGWLLSDCLSGGMSAPLFTRVREQKELCYSVDSSYDPNMELFTISFATTSANVGACIGEINAVIYDLIEDGIDDRMWELAANKSKVEISRLDESQSSLLSTLLSEYFANPTKSIPSDVNFLLEAASSFTKDDVIAYAKRIFAGEPTQSLFGDVPDHYLEEDATVTLEQETVSA